MQKNFENLHLMSYEELQTLKGQVETMMAMKHAGFKIGQKVQIDSPKFAGVTCEVVKVNHKKCKLDINGQLYNVPKHMILI
jgi:transcription antitermination factor NusG